MPGMGTILFKIDKVSFSDEVKFEQRPEGSEEASETISEEYQGESTASSKALSP